MSMTSTSDYGASRSLTAMFDTRAEADRAVEALRAAGIADVVLTGGENAGYTAERAENRTEERGFFEALGDFFFPDEDRYVYAEGLNRGGFLVTVSNIPAHQYETALDILDDEGAVDLDARESEWRSQGWSYDSRGETRSESDMLPGEAAFTARDEGLPGTMASRAMDRAGDALGTDSTRDQAMDREGDSMTGALGAAANRGADRDEGLPGTMASRAADRMGDSLSGIPTHAEGDRTYAEGDLNRDGTIDIVEERMQIAKREAELGRVRVRSYVREIPVEESVNLREEHVSIERRPVDRAATDADFRDQTIEAREYTEEAVVNKEARVVEEVALRKDVQNREEVVRDTLRKTEVEIEDDRGTAIGSDSLAGDSLGGGNRNDRV